MSEASEIKYPEGCTRVLDHGFVKLIDSMGDDSAIVQAARVSYGKGTKQVSEDRGLIRYLMRHEHTTPFEMVEFKFLCRMPIFVARQWIRHRTASVNEYSGRYSEVPDICYVPEVDKITKQSTTNKQGGSAEVIEDAAMFRESMIDESGNSFLNYKNYLDSGMRKELARINLPLSSYTEWYWKIDLKNLLHFLKLRLDSHAQYEIQVYGQAMAEMVKAIVPIAWEAFEDYHLNAMKLSSLDITAIRRIIRDQGSDVTDLFSNKREHEEFQAKLNRFVS